MIRRSFSLVITLPVWHWDNGWQMKLQRVFVRASNCTQTLVGQIQCDRSKWKICMAQDRACEDFESFIVSPCVPVLRRKKSLGKYFLLWAGLHLISLEHQTKKIRSGSSEPPEKKRKLLQSPSMKLSHLGQD